MLPRLSAYYDTLTNPFLLKNHRLVKHVLVSILVSLVLDRREHGRRVPMHLRIEFLYVRAGTDWSWT